jgi:hypothetical protein
MTEFLAIVDNYTVWQRGYTRIDFFGRDLQTVWYSGYFRNSLSQGILTESFVKRGLLQGVCTGKTYRLL